MGSTRLYLFLTIVTIIWAYGDAYGDYLTNLQKDAYVPDDIVREFVNRFPHKIDFLDNADDLFLDSILKHKLRATQQDTVQQNPKSILSDYDLILENNPSPSLRDQEFLQQSALWGHQYVSGGMGEGPRRLKPQIKTDASLPAYCNPPNPCPVGYTEEQGCQKKNFENTAAFSREYQAAQECMCDGEHMFDCSIDDDGDDDDDVGVGGGGGGGVVSDDENQELHSNLEDFLSQHPFRTTAGEHKNMVAKKYKTSKMLNPYLQGEKLPVAAKKGNHVN